MEIKKTAKVIVSLDAISGQFYSKRSYLHSITTEWPNIPEERLLPSEHSGRICDDIYVMAHIPQIHPIPEGNQHLFVQDMQGQFVQDDFRHELALYTNGLLFTGCAHSGLENILAACPFPVKMVVGGFHLLDNHEDEARLTELSHKLTDAYPQTQFYTSHCTGDAVFTTLHQVMGDKIHAFSCGTTNIDMTKKH
jgi:7,8-dihydropterin-6-yl-methyl-4-(beta-D-ribofuranosyl)aminobenzene 5'-phosphate synthase